MDNNELKRGKNATCTIAKQKVFSAKNQKKLDTQVIYKFIVRSGDTKSAKKMYLEQFLVLWG